MPIPKSLSKKKQHELLNQPHHKKPDLSNLIKFVEDALIGILFVDDRQITTIHATKIYHKIPKTLIKIKRTLNEDEDEVSNTTSPINNY